MKKYHLFYSEEAASIYRTVYYKLENGKLVKCTEAIEVHEDQLVPSTNWPDAEYLGIGYYEDGIELNDR